MTLLAIEDVSMVFGGVRALDALSLGVAAGKIHAMIGPNGAGKTTLFNIATGIYRPTAGRVTFDGADITDELPHARAARGIARTFQNLQLFYNMSALENVMVGGHLRLNRSLLAALTRTGGIAAADAHWRAECAEIMGYVGLGQYRNADTGSLPYGALKRLEIARALAAKPKLLLLDEPAAGLNMTETREIDALIVKIAASGVTVVLVEHNMNLVMGISDHIIVLDYGRKIAEGTAAAVRANPQVIAAYLGVAAGAA
jgi:branched-chain amino acid transport system ATP-binding protein